MSGGWWVGAGARLGATATRLGARPPSAPATVHGRGRGLRPFCFLLVRVVVAVEVAVVLPIGLNFSPIVAAITRASSSESTEVLHKLSYR